jgi:hypothetical protein
MDDELEMKDYYDFPGAHRGKFYRPLDQLKIPVYLHPQVSKDLDSLLGTDKRDLTTIVNDILRKDIELLRTMSVSKL